MSGRFKNRQTVSVVDDIRAKTAEQLQRVIAWEVAAQVGVQRAVGDMPPLIADTLLDYFDVTLRPDVDLSALG